MRCDASLASLADELLVVLDEQIALLELRRRQLESLSTAIIERDDDRLVLLLEQIERAQHEQNGADARLGALRAQMASAAGCNAAKLRLSELIEKVQPTQASALNYRRSRIMVLADLLRRQHLSTAVLLMECMRVNRLLLESLLPQSQSLTTYGAGGAQSWRLDTGVVDTEL